jgi:hypothetical protein
MMKQNLSVGQSLPRGLSLTAGPAPGRGQKRGHCITACSSPFNDSGVCARHGGSRSTTSPHRRRPPPTCADGGPIWARKGWPPDKTFDQILTLGTVNPPHRPGPLTCSCVMRESCWQSANSKDHAHSACLTLLRHANSCGQASSPTNTFRRQRWPFVLPRAEDSVGHVLDFLAQARSCPRLCGDQVF